MNKPRGPKRKHDPKDPTRPMTRPFYGSLEQKELADSLKTLSQEKIDAVKEIIAQEQKRA